ncbi:MAG: DHA2 family efflux MFS transporter permease subunit [Thermoleophilia bacterium]|nr:DHA2 family efflux MFS transporter permease subunit [Thermoleophilia bacterium]
MFATDRRTKLLTLGAMCFALFMAMLDNTVVNVALPSISESLGSGISGLQWIVDAYTLVFATLLLTGGTLGDLLGRKKCFLAGLVVFTAGSLLCALAPSLSVLIAGRGVQGIGAAVLMPGTLAILTNTFPDPRERAQAIGIWAGVSGLALAMGPVIGGLLVDSLGWQSVFYLNVPVGVIALVVAWLVVREFKHSEGRRLDLPGQALAIVTLGALTYALIEANNYGWTSPLILALFATTAVGLAAFILVELRSSSPMLELRFFRNPTFTAGAVCAAVISFGMFGMFFFLSLFLQNVQGYTPLEAGIRTLPCTGMILIFAPLAGRLAGRIGSRLPMTLGLAVNALSLFLFTRVQVETPYGDIWPILSLAGFGMAIVMTPMTAAIMGAVPQERAGMASATTNASREIGGVFGIALLGAVVTQVLTRDLSRLIDGLGLPPALKDTILERAGRGLSQAGGDLAAGGSYEALATALKESFMSGMHVAVIVAGATLVMGAVVTLVFVRQPSPGEDRVSQSEGGMTNAQPRPSSPDAIYGSGPHAPSGTETDLVPQAVGEAAVSQA